MDVQWGSSAMRLPSWLKRTTGLRFFGHTSLLWTLKGLLDGNGGFVTVKIVGLVVLKPVLLELVATAHQGNLKTVRIAARLLL